jgi:hypothetical protein
MLLLIAVQCDHQEKVRLKKVKKVLKVSQAKKAIIVIIAKIVKNSKTNPLISYLTKNKVLNKKPATKKIICL